jgi:uncharacterized membrane protein YphA (DoxX/SURF4 family)
MANLERHADLTALLGRLFLASMFLLFGYGKITAFEPPRVCRRAFGLSQAAIAGVSNVA